MSCVGNPKEHHITTQNTSETKILWGKRNFSLHRVVTEMLTVNLPNNRASSLIAPAPFFRPILEGLGSGILSGRLWGQLA